MCISSFSTAQNLSNASNSKSPLLVKSKATPQDIVVSLPYLPAFSETVDNGILIELIKEMDKEYEGRFIVRKIFPFKRSMHNLLTGKADLHMPILFDPSGDNEKLAYSHSKERIFEVIFAVYTKNGITLNHDDLSQYHVETDSAHVGLFPFFVSPSISIEQSLKKLNSGRVDAFIFAAKETDAVLQRLGLNSQINRKFYKKYDVKIALRKDRAGAQLDEKLSKIIQKLNEKGTLKRIFLPVDNYYNNWQEDTD